MMVSHLVLMMDHLKEKYLDKLMAYYWVSRMVLKLELHLDLMMEMHLV